MGRKEIQKLMKLQELKEEIDRVDDKWLKLRTRLEHAQRFGHIPRKEVEKLSDELEKLGSKMDELQLEYSKICTVAV